MKLLEHYDEFENNLKRFAYGLSKNDWEDLIQYAWIKAMSNQYIFEDMNMYQTRGWFYTVIRNKHFDDVKRYKRIINTVSDKEDFITGDFTGEVISKQDVLKLLDVLSDDDRQIVMLRYYSGKNSKEIGQILCMNSSTVRYRLTSAIARMRKRINRSDYYD